MSRNEGKSRADIYARITDRIVADLERGVRPWVKPWGASNMAGRITRPLHAAGLLGFAGRAGRIAQGQLALLADTAVDHHFLRGRGSQAGAEKQAGGQDGAHGRILRAKRRANNAGRFRAGRAGQSTRRESRRGVPVRRSRPR